VQLEQSVQPEQSAQLKRPVRPITIRHLCEVPNALPTVARAYVTAWMPYYGPGGPGNAFEDLAECCHSDRLPICLLAMNGDTVVGTVSLKDSSISHPHLSPWGTALLVFSDCLGQGIGRQLVVALERIAGEHGFKRLYMSTDAATALLLKCGWRQIDTAQSLHGTVAICKRDLPGP
jgi:GNAT superfamily N-acetyltransferase